MNHQYKILPSDYFWRGKEIFEEFQKSNVHDLLFYSALDYRNCIERILFDELYLLNIDNLPRKFEKLYRIKDLANTILEIEPDFLKKLEFINIYFEAMGIGEFIFIPDLDYLNNIYGRLGNYLHCLKDPTKTIENSEWWTGFTDLLIETEKYVSKVIGSTTASFQMNDKGNDLFIRWREGEIDKDEVVRQVRIDFYE